MSGPQGLECGVIAPDSAERYLSDTAELQGGEHVARRDDAVVMNRQLAEDPSAGAEKAHVPA